MGDWIYGIVAVMLFGRVILQVTPEGAYQKYVRLFMGAVLMLAVVSPVFSLFGLSEEIRLSFEQNDLFSWWGTEASWSQENKGAWQSPDPWEESMREQMYKKQEAWLIRSLAGTVQEYGFVCLAQKVEWNDSKNWPRKLTLWLAREGEDRGSTGDGETLGDTIVAGTAVGSGMDIINPIDAVPYVGAKAENKAENDADGSTYYEPSELRPLHQALQMIWQLEEGQIILYYER